MNENINLNTIILNENKKLNYIQVIRGIAILGIVLIHATSSIATNKVNIFLRQFINCSVPIFFFISGYLITPEKFNNKNYIKSFYKKRFLRVGIPYLVFSIIDFILNDNLRHASLTKKLFFLLTGQANNSIYYYIIVYLQLIIITPFLIKLIHKINPIYIYSLSFLTILIQYVFTWINNPLPFPYNALPFTTWMLFYYMGIIERNIKKPINIKKNLTLTIIMLIFSIIEGFIWSKFFNSSIGKSQIKITSFLYSYYFIKVLLFYKEALNNKILKFWGDNSFGIYLIHMFIMRKFINFFSCSNNILNIIITTIVTILVSLLFIFIIKKLFGKKLALNIFGF